LKTSEAAGMVKDSARQVPGSLDQSEASIAPVTWAGLERLVVIDSTWNQTNAIAKVFTLKYCKNNKLQPFF